VTFYSKKTLTLNSELGSFLRHFLCIEASNRVFAIRPTFEDLRTWDKLQTFPKDCYAVSKSIIEKLSHPPKNH
jgi:hypothetical protein